MVQLVPEHEPRRREVRNRLGLRVQGTLAGDALVRALSTTELLLETADDLDLGQAIEVELPGAGRQRAKVERRTGNMFNCRFDRPISPATIRELGLPSPSALRPSASARKKDRTVNLSATRQRLPLRIRVILLVALGLGAWGLLILALC